MRSEMEEAIIRYEEELECACDVEDFKAGWQAALHSVEAEKEPVTQEMIKAGLDAIGPCMGSCGEASPPDSEDVEACYLAMKALDQAATGIQTEKEPEWTRCADRLPTESDEDFNGRVWYEFDGDITYATAEFVSGFGAGYPGANWKSTGLRRPAPPEHKPE